MNERSGKFNFQNPFFLSSSSSSSYSIVFDNYLGQMTSCAWMGIINLRYRYLRLMDVARQDGGSSRWWKYFNNETKFQMYKFSAIASSRFFCFSSVTSLRPVVEEQREEDRSVIGIFIFQYNLN